MHKFILAIAGLLLMSCVTEQNCQAETPLVINFDAMISEIDGDAMPLNLPFSFNIGDRIDGQLSFNSREEALQQLQGNTTVFLVLYYKLETRPLRIYLM